MDDMQEAVRRLFADGVRAPMTTSDIAEALGLRGAARKRLQRALHALRKEGVLSQTENGRFQPGSPEDVATGTLAIARSGTGFLRTDDGREVRIPKGETGTALPGDRVLVRLEPSGVGEPLTGKVTRVLERVRRDIVGTLHSTGQFFYVAPMDPAYQEDIYVRDARPEHVGQRVVVRFGEWLNRHVNPEGTIVEVLGPPDRPSVDTECAIRHFGLRVAFPDETLREAERVATLADEPGERLDLRGRFIVTIDPARARDFDDALSLESDGAGRRVLGVHIADVAHFVHEGGELDKEARARGNSTYFPDRVLPMLPEQLSNGVCSLKPDTDRLTFSAFLTLDADGAIVARRFAKSVIRSSRRLTYEEAMAAIVHAQHRRPAHGRHGVGTVTPVDPARRDEAGLEDLLWSLCELAQQLRQRRFAEYAMDLDMPECEIVLDAEGQATDVRLVANDLSHQLVEECMVAANEAVATELAEAGFPFIARRHDPPRQSRISELDVELASYGLHAGDLSDRKRLAKFLIHVGSHPLGHMVRMAILRSMCRAVYDTVTEGHYGLAKRYYLHFTSPIRRYPDLTVHRQLASLLDARAVKGRQPSPRHKPRGRRPAAGAETATPSPEAEAEKALRVTGWHCSRTEQNSDEAERMVVETLKLRLLERRLMAGDNGPYDGIVVRVTSFGLFIELRLFQIQGLLPIGALHERGVRFDRRHGSLTAGRRNFRAGTALKVFVTRVDFERRQLDFRPA
jgi:ribonuclease R